MNIPSRPRSFLENLSSSKFIECDYTRAKRFREENEDYPATHASTFRNAVKHTLKKSKKVFNELGIRFWLGSGTCLGWFRECDTIGVKLNIKACLYRLLQFLPRVTLCLTEFIEMKVSVPCNTLEYIETMYGKTWKQKVEKRKLRYNASDLVENG
ncbi:ribitol-5-phosphate transferase FKTN-like [Saccoglossus kowalevskii]